jgi:hypothetical protein
MTDIPQPQPSTIRCLLKSPRENSKTIQGEPTYGIEPTMLAIIREIGGLADYILGVWNGSGQQEPLTDNRPDFLYVGRIFTHLLELMNWRGVEYTDETDNAIGTSIDNPRRYRQWYEIPITLHFSAITRSITTFGWKDATERDLNNAAADIIVALWNIGRSLNFNPEAALVYVAGGIPERRSMPADPRYLVAAEDHERMVGNTEKP